MLKVFDFLCESCGKQSVDALVEDGECAYCSDCDKAMKRLFPCPRGGEQRGKFQPFWSDTMQMRISDREDLKKLVDYRKQNGLTCVGHEHQKPDRRAIRWNADN